MQTPLAGNSAINNKNYFHLYADIFWWGILAGSLIAFLGIYLARLGATSFQLSVLTAGPAIISLVISLPAGKWLETRSFVRVAFVTSIYHRLGYALILLGMIFFAEHLQISLILWITVVMSVPGTVLMIAFNAMFAEIVPPEMRATVVGNRNAFLAVSMTTTSLVSGQLLDRIISPLNYQIVFGIGILGALLSCYHLGRIRALPGFTPQIQVGKPILDRARPGRLSLPFSTRYVPGMRFLTRGVTMLRPDLLRSNFGAFLGAMFFFYVAQNLVVPLFPSYQVDKMGLSDSVISIGSAFFQVAVFFTSMRLGAVSERFGHHRVMVYSVLGYAAFPLFIGLMPNIPSYIAGAALGGIGWGFLGGAAANRLMERVPEDDRPAHMALFNITLNLGVLIGSLLGPVVGDFTGLQAALLIGAGARLFSGWVLWRWG
jgi:MFS family permease